MDPITTTITFSAATIVFSLVLLHFFLRIGRAESDVRLIKHTINSMLVAQTSAHKSAHSPESQAAGPEGRATPSESITSTGSLFLRHNMRSVSAPFAAATPVASPPVFVPGSVSPPPGLTPIQNLWETTPLTSPAGVAVVVLSPTAGSGASSAA